MVTRMETTIHGSGIKPPMFVFVRGATSRPAARAPKARRRESGQATVEATIALFLMCFVIMAVIGLIVGAFSVNATLGGVEVAAWEFDVSQMQQAKDKDAYVKETIMARVPGIDANSLEVTGAAVTVSETKDSTKVQSKTDFGESKLTYKTTTANVKCKITYTVPFTQGLLKVSRDIDHDIRVTTDAEVS